MANDIIIVRMGKTERFQKPVAKTEIEHSPLRFVAFEGYFNDADNAKKHFCSFRKE